MIKAHALLLSVVIALLIAMICGFFILLTYYSSLESYHYERQNSLIRSANSGLALAMSCVETQQVLESGDTVVFQKEKWGIYQFLSVTAKNGNFKNTKTCLVGTSPSEGKPTLKIVDDNRPLALCGSTKLVGLCELPKAGVKRAYISGKSFVGKDLVQGTVKVTDNKLSAIDESVLKLINGENTMKLEKVVDLYDSVVNSFDNDTSYIIKNCKTLSNKVIKGNVIIRTIFPLYIDASTILDNVLVFAPAIEIEKEFRGRAQFFVRDSMVVGKNVIIEYPSVIGLLKSDQKSDVQPKVHLEEGGEFRGVVFSYQNR